MHESGGVRNSFKLLFPCPQHPEVAIHNNLHNTETMRTCITHPYFRSMLFLHKKVAHAKEGGMTRIHIYETCLQ